MNLWTVLRNRLRGTKPPHKPLVSIVLLLREPRDLLVSVLECAAQRAWPGEFGREDGGSFVVQQGPIAIVKRGGDLLHVLNSAQPYGKSPARASKSIPELRRRKAWKDHNAWTSVNSVAADGIDEYAIRDKFQLLGKLTAELLNENCTGTYIPEYKIVIPNHDPLSDRLRMFSTVEELSWSDSQESPVIEPDESKLAEVTQEARSRWPEFCEAFNNRKPGEEFSVKALFSDGKNGEWMWVSVDSIEDGDISGSLENSPVDVRDVSRGDQVRVRAAEIGDWVYSRNGIDHGGFSRILFR